MTNFQHHLTEIKYRCVYLMLSALLTFCMCSSSQLELFYLIGKPFLEVHQTFVFLDLTEAFYTVLRLSLVFTIVLWIPFFFYQIWSFLIPSCYQFQRKTVISLCVFFFFLVVIEFGITYFIFLPKIFNFLLSFEISSPTMETTGHLDPLVRVEFTARIKSYVSLLVKLFLGLLVLFQTPFCFFFLFSKKLVHVSSLYSNRRISWLICLLVSAFLVPPDLFTQLLVACFFSLVCELVIFIGLFFED